MELTSSVLFMNLSNLAPRPGSKRRCKRVGCGESSGHGKTSGKGHKGQKARSGGSIRLGFEGGQMPLARKIPKRGFSNRRFRVAKLPITLGALSTAFDADSTVSLDLLVSSGLCRHGEEVKILSGGVLSKRLSVRGLPLCASARREVLSLGGSIE